MKRTNFLSAGWVEIEPISRIVDISIYTGGLEEDLEMDIHVE